MKLPAYPRTKPSGVEWLGDVPEHWEVKGCAVCSRSHCSMGRTSLPNSMTLTCHAMCESRTSTRMARLRPETLSLSAPSDVAAPLTSSQMATCCSHECGATSGRHCSIR